MSENYLKEEEKKWLMMWIERRAKKKQARPGENLKGLHGVLLFVRIPLCQGSLAG